MSVITDVAIIAHDSEQDAVAALCSALRIMPGQLGDGFRLNGGTKVGSLAAWGGAFNYLDWEDFCEAAKSAPWKFPDWVTVVRLHESDDVPLRLGIADL